MFWVGLALLVLGTGPLLMIVVAAELGLTSDRDVHDLYNLAWAASIARGYARHGTRARPWNVGPWSPGVWASRASVLPRGVNDETTMTGSG